VDKAAFREIAKWLAKSRSRMSIINITPTVRRQETR